MAAVMDVPAYCFFWRRSMDVGCWTRGRRLVRVMGRVLVRLARFSTRVVVALLVQRVSLLA